MLEVADSTLTYRSRYNLLPNIAAVYDLVLLDDTNPRSLFFQINQLAQHFERLPRESESVTAAAKNFARLQLAPAHSRSARTRRRGRKAGRTAKLAAAHPETLRDLPRLSDAIAVELFCALGNFAHRAEDAAMNLRPHPSHDLRIRRAGDGFAPRRARSNRACYGSRQWKIFAAQSCRNRRCSSRAWIISATRSAVSASRKFIGVSKSRHQPRDGGARPRRRRGASSPDGKAR